MVRQILELCTGVKWTVQGSILERTYLPLEALVVSEVITSALTGCNYSLSKILLLLSRYFKCSADWLVVLECLTEVVYKMQHNFFVWIQNISVHWEGSNLESCHCIEHGGSGKQDPKAGPKIMLIEGEPFPVWWQILEGQNKWIKLTLHSQRKSQREMKLSLEDNFRRQLVLEFHPLLLP